MMMKRDCRLETSTTWVTYNKVDFMVLLSYPGEALSKLNLGGPDYF